MAKLALKLSPSGVLTQAYATQAVGGWPPVEGTVRPAMPREVEKYRDDLGRSKDPAGTQAEFYARHVSTWDVCGEAGEPLPVTAESLLALPFPVWVQLEAIVLGSGGGEVLGNGSR